jgi:hypothetical protein
MFMDWKTPKMNPMEDCTTVALPPFFFFLITLKPRVE